MKQILFVITVMGLFQMAGFAQTSVPTPRPLGTPAYYESNRTYGQGVKAASGGIRSNRQLANSNSIQEISALYRKSTKEELKQLAVNDEDRNKYAVFLKNNEAGLFKLIPDLDCSQNAKVIVATPDCLKYSMPGNGASYSFRVKDYRISHLADIAFGNDSFQITGQMLQGILVEIGDISLEKAETQLPKLSYLMNFHPASTVEQLIQENKKLQTGIVQDGFVYGNTVKAVDNKTYVLRSIAYDTNLYRSVNGITYDEMKFDKRQDVTVAFRIIRREENKSVVILWKELDRKKSPKITMK